MNTEANISDRRDAQVAGIILGALGILWLVLRLYWQGALLICAAGLLVALVMRRREDSEPSTSDQAPEPKSPADRKPRRGKRRRR